MGSRSVTRRCVVQALYQWQLQQRTPLNSEDVKFIVAKDVKRIDRAYFDELLSDIINSVDVLDEHISPLLDRSLSSLDPVERAVLWLGACELASHHDVPYRVVINEAVDQAKVFGAEGGYKYVNGILDKLAKILRSVEMSGQQAKKK